ncbi:MAG TPA: YerC/YecD family TrpR-related protein [Rhodanobacteraceae bacterium]
MKHRTIDRETSAQSAELELCMAILSLRSVDEMRAFLHDLCTPAELEALVDRWSVVPLVLDRVSYRRIHQRTAVSVTTIGRVAYFLRRGSDGYRTAANRTLRPQRGVGRAAARANADLHCPGTPKVACPVSTTYR